MPGPSIHLQLRRTGDKNGDLPGRYRSAQCVNPNPACRLLIDWRLQSQRDPATIRSHPVIRTPLIDYIYNFD